MSAPVALVVAVFLGGICCLLYWLSQDCECAGCAAARSRRLKSSQVRKRPTERLSVNRPTERLSEYRPKERLSEYRPKERLSEYRPN